MSLPYSEGSWFAVPLKPNGYALGLVARTSHRGGPFLGYFFGPRRKKKPSMKATEGLQADTAVKILMVGDLGLMEGNWTILGPTPSWTRSDWPVPQFVRRSELSRRAWKVTYSDDDMNVLETEESIPYESEGLEPDTLFGYVAAEVVLSKVLS